MPDLALMKLSWHFQEFWDARFPRDRGGVLRSPSPFCSPLGASFEVAPDSYLVCFVVVVFFCFLFFVFFFAF